ncbi:MAG: ester cyclase [Chloroflexi bacterium]|nr:ester cyclase [Chloroflexota bacterium]
MSMWCSSFDAAQTTPCRTEANRELLRQISEVQWTGREDLTKLDAYLSDDLLMHGFGMSNLDKKGYLDAVADTLTLYTVPQHDSMALIAESDLVAGASLWSGIFSGGAEKGLKPTFKQAAVSDISFYRVLDGKIAEIWLGMNTLSLYQQFFGYPSDGEALPDQPWTVVRSETRLNPVEQRALLCNHIMAVNRHDLSLLEDCWAADATAHWIPLNMHFDLLGNTSRPST